MPIPQHAQNRINAAKQRKNLRVFNYVKMNPNGFNEQVLCKKCGVPVVGLVEADQPTSITRANGQVIVTKRMVMAQLPEYSEVEIEFDDGSKHLTPACKRCAPNLTADDIEDMFSADIEQWSKELGFDRMNQNDFARTVKSWRQA